ncbi:hypothetical protein GCM10029978_094430 [Actinoallomurus acanthiterrae]
MRRPWYDRDLAPPGRATWRGDGVEFVDNVAYRELPVEEVVGLLTDDDESSLPAVVDQRGRGRRLPRLPE